MCMDQISLPEFTTLIRGRMNPRRLELVSVVFAGLQRAAGCTRDGGGVDEQAVRRFFVEAPSTGKSSAA